jgi:hypothetical protein
MSFVIGLLLFTVVVGALDARIPWTSGRRERSS